jgi:hypothetical protein
LNATAALPEAAGSRAESARPLRIVFVFMSLMARLRIFGSVIEELLARGHTVHLVVEDDSEHGSVEHAWLAELEHRPGFSWEVRRALRTDRWYWPAVTLRRAAEYVRWHRPEYADRQWFRDRAARRSPRWVRALLRPRFMRTGPAVAAVEATMRPLERAMPIGRNVRAAVEELRPDLLLLCPDLSTGSLSSVWVTAAQEQGIPVGACIASWDNLTSKQLLGVVPDMVVVWNRIQEREAQEIHGIPADRVVVTGAQCFDQWFDWTPRPREEFCARAGLEPSRPYILYVAGALAHTAPPELDLVHEWLRRLRTSRHASLHDVGVLIRPHPQRTEQWSKLKAEEHENVAMFPRPPVPMPLSAEARADYYDSIYHSATVVGLNTTAMIEAAIVGRSVHTLLFPEYDDTQGATVHFEYLFTVGGGILRPATTFEEHEDQLAEALAEGEEKAAAQSRRFLEEFVRPYGLEEPATPRFIDAVEQLGTGSRSAPARTPLWVPPLRALVIAGVYLAQPREVVRGLQVRARRLLGRS